MVRRAVLAAGMLLAPIVVVTANQAGLAVPQDDSSVPAFEAASVKPNKSEDLPTFGGMQPGGHLLLFNVPLRLLIRNAYQFQDRQVVGPTWMSSERFDIEAKASGDLPLPRPGKPAPSQLMMRRLLADRFKLVVHQETGVRASYSLELARPDGSLGPQLRRSRVDCAAMAGTRQRDDVYCGFQSQGTGATGGQMRAGGFPLSQLATVLSQMFQAIVVDNTGLSGDFDWDVKWSADNASPSGAVSDGPSIFTALQEQLGLRLHWGNAPVPLLVVDHVERPTPD